MAATNGDAELTVAEEAKEEEEATDDGSGGVSSQWLRAAVLGASDGLVSTAALMLGIGAACPADARAVLLSGLAGLVAVAWPSASRPPVRANRPRRRPRAARCLAGRNRARGSAPASAPAGLRLQAAAVSPSSQATAASTLSFAAGAMFPLLAAWAVVGGLLAMAATYGVMKLFRTHGV
uniref:Vacuolar iron transporter n=1 Tax=Oryza barthii TaxID=65489 RepID=A0A0D3HIK2_9ORYZ